jgi:hypothetical protein
MRREGAHPVISLRSEAETAICNTLPDKLVSHGKPAGRCRGD